MASPILILMELFADLPLEKALAAVLQSQAARTACLGSSKMTNKLSAATLISTPPLASNNGNMMDCIIFTRLRKCKIPSSLQMREKPLMSEQNKTFGKTKRA
jgi:hypothetical protein